MREDADVDRAVSLYTFLSILELHVGSQRIEDCSCW
jgi:hypothetical protein